MAPHGCNQYRIAQACCCLCKLRFVVQTAVKQEVKKSNAAAGVTHVSVAGMGGEEQGAAARGSPDNDGTGTAARKSEKVRQCSLGSAGVR